MWFLSILGLLPKLLDVFTTWQKNCLDAQVQLYQAKTGTDKTTATAAVQENNANTEKLRIVAGNKWLTWLFVLGALPPILTEAKVMLVDKIACPAVNLPLSVAQKAAGVHQYFMGLDCMTDPTGGAVAVWAAMAMGALFGYGTMQTVASNWFARRS